jgi:hypothetical protein
MKPLKMMVVFLLLLPVLVQAQKKPKKPIVPAVFEHARYAYVQAMDGDEFDPRLLPEDREAIANVENAVRDWGRYKLTVRREDADIVFVVRKGRLATLKGGVDLNRGGNISVGTSPQNGQNPGPRNGQGNGAGSEPGTDLGNDPGTELETGGDLGPKDDFFEVCLLDSGGRLGSPLWERTLGEGLIGRRPILFMQFKDAVDKAYPPAPAGQPVPAGQTAPPGQSAPASQPAPAGDPGKPQ